MKRIINIAILAVYINIEGNYSFAQTLPNSSEIKEEYEISCSGITSPSGTEKPNIDIILKGPKHINAEQLKNLKLKSCCKLYHDKFNRIPEPCKNL